MTRAQAEERAREIVRAFHLRGNTGLTQLEHDFAEALLAAERRGAEAMREKAALVADDPYGDAVAAIYGEGPKSVGKKIAAAISALPLPGDEGGSGE